MTRIPRYAVIALALTLTACSPSTPELKPVASPTTVTYKGLSFSKPTDLAGFIKLRDQELLKAVKDKKLTVAEAKAFLISEKKRLGPITGSDPNNTPGFDKKLREAGLLN
jgi:hypothetical protein